jgi:ATP-dependent HslUV protease subunit HslV
MTTIAYKDGVMASDSACSHNETVVFDVQKVFKNDAGFLLGLAGTLMDVGIMKAWFFNEDLNDVPRTKAYGILVSPKGKVYFAERGLLTPVKGKHVATGSGRDLALGAMDAGASAVEAVRIASKRDSATQLPIQKVTLE